ncbi:hypothetical protein N9G63_04915 [Chitinophagales bacterium]|nr:hypothetical protein [Chitinophagales bacterium]
MKKIAILFTLTLLSFPAFSQTFSIELDKDSILIGDHFTLNMTLQLNGGELGYFPQLVDSAMTFDSIQAYPVDTIPNGIQQKIVLTQFEAGIYEISQLPALVQRSNGTLDTLKSNTATLYVGGIDVDTTQAFKPIKTVKSIPFPWKDFLKKLALWLIPILVILALIVWYILRKRDVKLFREKPKTPIDYYHEAIDKLQTLENKKLWQNDQVKEYYLGLSEILREYLEGRFGIQAMESTTDEINNTLILQDKLKLKLREVLAQADLAKFAKFKPLGDENIRLMKQAKDFVRHTKPKLKAEEVHVK